MSAPTDNTIENLIRDISMCYSEEKGEDTITNPDEYTKKIVLDYTSQKIKRAVDETNIEWLKLWKKAFKNLNSMIDKYEKIVKKNLSQENLDINDKKMDSTIEEKLKDILMDTNLTISEEHDCIDEIQDLIAEQVEKAVRERLSNVKNTIRILAYSSEFLRDKNNKDIEPHFMYMPISEINDILDGKTGIATQDDLHPQEEGGEG